MLEIKREDVFLEETVKIFDDEFNVKIVLEPAVTDYNEKQDFNVWALKAIEAMTITDKKFYKVIRDNKLEAKVLEYLTEKLQKKENS